MTVHEESKVSGKKHWGEKLNMQSNCHFLVGKGEDPQVAALKEGK